jgi:hypothetical protein
MAAKTAFLLASYQLRVSEGGGDSIIQHPLKTNAIFQFLDPYPRFYPRHIARTMAKKP